jgi:hypothetical protein
VRARLAAAALLLIAASSQAHLKFPELRAERWIELELDQDPIQLGYRLGFGAELAKQERKRADRDGDGEVSAAEGNAALDLKTAELLERLRVCTGDSPAELDCVALGLTAVELVEAEGWIPGPTGHLHFAWTLRLRSGARRLGAIRIEDDWQIPGVEITDVRIAPPAAISLTSAGEGDSPEGVRTQFTWIEARRGLGPRVVSASWPKQDDTAATRVAAALFMVLVGALLLYRAHKARGVAGPG